MILVLAEDFPSKWPYSWHFAVTRRDVRRGRGKGVHLEPGVIGHRPAGMLLPQAAFLNGIWEEENNIPSLPMKPVSLSPASLREVEAAASGKGTAYCLHNPPWPHTLFSAVGGESLPTCSLCSLLVGDSMRGPEPLMQW